MEKTGIKLVNGRYQVEIRDAQRKKIRKRFDTKTEAATWRAEQVYLRDHGHLIKPEKDTIAQLCDTWYEGKSAEGYQFTTLQNWANEIRYIKSELGDVRVQKLIPLMCEEAARQWAARASAKFANTILKTFTAVLNDPLRHGKIEYNAAERAKRIKVSREEITSGVKRNQVYNQEQMAALLEASEPGSLERLLVWFAGFLGLRIGEILALSWLAIDLKARTLHVMANLVSLRKDKAEFPGYKNTGRGLRNPKSESGDRWLEDLSADCIQDCRLWKMKCPPSRPVEVAEQSATHRAKFGPIARALIMITVEGKPLQRKKAQAMLDQVITRANDGRAEPDRIPRFTLHRCRHSFASQMINEGEPISTVSKLLGHADVGVTTKTYTHFVQNNGTTLRDHASRVLNGRKVN